MPDLLPDNLTFTAILFAVGVISGALNALGGSGGLVILTYMIGSGIPPALALGTARLANILPMFLAFKKYQNAGHVDHKYLLPILLIAILSGALGTFLIINLPEEYVYKIVGVLMLIIGPLILIKKDFGLESETTSSLKKYAGFGLYLLSMIYAGFFGAGTTIMVVYIFVVFFGMKSISAVATNMIAWVAMSLISSAIFIYYGQIDYQYLLTILLSMGLGSWIGTNLAIKKGSQLINIFVSLFAFIMGIRLLFFL